MNTILHTHEATSINSHTSQFHGHTNLHRKGKEKTTTQQVATSLFDRNDGIHPI